jgi:V/A-type H+-transporting ATPase subunit C
MKPFDTKNPFMTGYIKGAEARVVTSDHLNRMMKASGIKDLLVIIRDTHIGQYLEEKALKNFDEADEDLWRYLGECCRALQALKQLPRDMRRFLEVFLRKYDIANIRAALRGLATGKPVRTIPLGSLHALGRLGDLGAAANAEGIAALLDECRLGSYASIVREYRPEEEVHTRLQLEARLYKEYYRWLMKAAREKDRSALMARAFGISIDFTNLQMVSRALIAEWGAQASEEVIEGGQVLSAEMLREQPLLKLADIPGRLEGTPYREAAEEIVSGYTASKDAGVIEETVEKHRFRLIREMLSQKLLSPVLIGWYLTLKEVEVRNVRLLLKAMFDNVPLEGIRPRLVSV